MKYPVMLSFAQVVALVDISSGYGEDDSPRHNSMTMAALTRRRLIGGREPKLTAKGSAYLEMALFEYYECSKVTKATYDRRRRHRRRKPKRTAPKAAA